MLAARKLAQTNFSSGSCRKLSVLSASYKFPFPQVEDKPLSAPVVKQISLDSGVRVISREKDSGVVSFKVAVAGGSSTETTAQRGSAFMLASAGYAGNLQQSGLSLVRYLESIGAEFSASSDREKVVYDVTVLANYFEPALNTILSILSTPADEEILSEAKGQAALLMKLRNSCNKRILCDITHEAAYGEGSPFGSNGLPVSVQKLSIPEVLAYRQAHFIRENLTIVSNGAVTADTIKKIVEGQSFPSKGNKGIELPANTFVGGEVKIRADLDGNTNLAVAFPIPAGSAGNAYHVLADVINAQTASQGVCAGAYTNTYLNGGLIGVRATGSVSTASEQLQKVLGVLKNIAGGSAAETDGARARLALSRAFAVEVGGSQATCALLADGGNSANDIRTLSSSAVVDAAKAVLKTANPAFAVYGATAGVPSYSAVQKFLA